MEILVGHPFGGAAVIAAASDIPQARAIATVAAPYDPSHVEHQYDAVVELLLLGPRNFVSLEGSDHLLTTPGQARRAARIISAWADQYLVD